jgi:hypothetical protein
METTISVPRLAASRSVSGQFVLQPRRKSAAEEAAEKVDL